MNSMPLTPDGEESDDYMDFFNSSPLKKKKTDSPSIDSIESGICFNCKGDAHENNLLLRDSYQAKEHFYKIVSDTGLLSDTEKNIFGRRIGFSHLNFKITHYFMVLKKNIIMLEDLSRSGRTLSNYNNNRPYEVRKDISNFFLMLSNYLKSLQVEEKDFRMTVISEIFDLLRFVSPFCSSAKHFTGISSPNGNQCTSGIHHYFHAQLDIRWWALCILHQIDADSVVTKLPDDVEPLVDEVSQDNEGVLSAFDNGASMVAWDIIFVLHRQIINTCAVENRIQTSFPCTCVHELSSSLLHILDNRANLFNQKSFWDLMKDKLLVLMKMAECADKKFIPVIASYPFFPPDSGVRISLKQVWVIFIELAKLYNWNAKGLLVSHRNDVVKAEPKLLKTLIRLSLKDSYQQLPENDLRFYLQSCLVLMDLWQKDKNCKGCECITAIWEFMVKNLNSCFSMGKTTLDGFSNQRKTPKKWFKQLNELDSDRNLTGKNTTSWLIFLKLIVGQLKGNWKVLQGRIYSKFHEKKMLELNSNGIYNTVSLFLTIGLHGDLYILCNKLLELLAFIPNIAVTKLQLVFSALFTVMHALVDKGVDISPVTKCLEERLSLIYKAIFSVSKDRRDLCSLVVFYSESTCLILEQSGDFSLSQEKLFCQPLAKLAGLMPASERSTLFSAVNCALATIIECSEVPHLLTDRRCLNLLLQLWSQYGSHVKYHPSMDDATRISSVAASFGICCVRLLLVADAEKAALREIAEEIFSRFINSDSSCGEMAQNFVIDLMKDISSINIAIHLFPDLEGSIINYGISTLINCGETSDVDELIGAIFRLPEVAKLVPDPSCHSFRAVEDLLIAVTQEFHHNKVFKTPLAAREKANLYFNSLAKGIHAVVNKVPVPYHIHQIMSFVGALFQYGCKIFYLQGKSDCLLANIFNKVILTSAICNAEKPLVKTVAEAYILLIPKVLLGLVILKNPSDDYIKSRFRDVIIHYLYRFSAAEHPFLTFFGYEKSTSVRIPFLETLRIYFISKRKCPTSHLHILFELLLRLCSKQKEWNPLICKYLFPNILELLLILDEQKAKFINNFLGKLFRQDEINGGHCRANILEDIRMFVSRELKFKSQKVFVILMNLCEVDGSVIVDCMEKILTVICETEEKRGTGHDAFLRKGYSNLQSKLKIFEEF